MLSQMRTKVHKVKQCMDNLYCSTLYVKSGTRVKKGERLFILEVGKLFYFVKAPKSGIFYKFDTLKESGKVSYDTPLYIIK